MGGVELKVVSAGDIVERVAELCVRACVVVAPDVRSAMEQALDRESGIARRVLEDMLLNQDVAIDNGIPICQDTGMVVVFLEIGQDVRIVGGDVSAAVQEGVRRGYTDGYLRKSVVGDPIDRRNTNDNTPAVIHYSVVPGDELKIIVCPKGFGSENMSRIKMLLPGDGVAGIFGFVTETVKLAASNPCPPIIVGVGVGGTFEYAALMAKRALLRKVGSRNADADWARREDELLERVNALGIGPSGFGGVTTALAVHINAYATHIAGLPVAVNLACHANRHEEAVL